MKTLTLKTLGLLLILSLFYPVFAQAVEALSADVSYQPMPQAMSNNAVAYLKITSGEYAFSFLGLGKGKTYQDTLASAWQYSFAKNQWRRLPDVPGKVGRLASVALGVGNKVYIFGGYTVAKDHSEVSTPFVHAFDPVKVNYTRLADMPTPVDDAVALVYQQRYIYLVSGWHNKGNVQLVQVFDMAQNSWKNATAYPGPGVFGHAGGIVGHRLLICDGVKVLPNAPRKQRYNPSPVCYQGNIDAKNPYKIDWRQISYHPGSARYRMAAVGVEQKKHMGHVLFVGGSDNPYNFNGIGYNGKPSNPHASNIAYSFQHQRWEKWGELKEATMDHRGLLSRRQQQFSTPQFYTLGGMGSKQQIRKQLTEIVVKVKTNALAK